MGRRPRGARPPGSGPDSRPRRECSWPLTPLSFRSLPCFLWPPNEGPQTGGLTATGIHPLAGAEAGVCNHGVGGTGARGQPWRRALLPLPLLVAPGAPWLVAKAPWSLLCGHMASPPLPCLSSMWLSRGLLSRDSGPTRLSDPSSSPAGPPWGGSRPAGLLDWSSVPSAGLVPSPRSTPLAERGDPRGPRL